MGISPCKCANCSVRSMRPPSRRFSPIGRSAPLGKPAADPAPRPPRAALPRRCRCFDAFGTSKTRRYIRPRGDADSLPASACAPLAADLWCGRSGGGVPSQLRLHRALGSGRPWPAISISCGFLLLGPSTRYPPHRHLAEEIYLPLCGTAHWQQGARGWEALPPGTVIHHESGVPHAMQTGSQPLLALYVWRGGHLDQKARMERENVR